MYMSPLSRSRSHTPDAARGGGELVAELALAQRGLRLLARRDVGVGADPLADAAVVGEDGHAAGLEMAVASVAGADAQLALIGALVRGRRHPYFHGAGPVVRVDELQPAELAGLLQGLPGQGFPRRRHEQDLAVGVRPPDDVHARGDERAQALFALPQRFFGLLALGDVAADGLELGQAALSVEERVVRPLLPPYLPGGQRDPVLDDAARALRREGFEVGAHPLVIGRRDQLHERAPDQILLGAVEVAAVGVVHEGDGGVPGEAADQLGLVFHHGPVAGFALAERVLDVEPLVDLRLEGEVLLRDPAAVEHAHGEGLLRLLVPVQEHQDETEADDQDGEEVHGQQRRPRAAGEGQGERTRGQEDAHRQPGPRPIAEELAFAYAPVDGPQERGQGEGEEDLQDDESAQAWHWRARTLQPRPATLSVSGAKRPSSGRAQA